MSKKMRRLLLVLSGMALVVFTGQAAVAGYPEKPITMYCVFAPGGPTDVTIRALASDAEKILGQPIVVVNKDGGAGTIGLAVLVNDKPDGYTLAAFASGGLTRIPLLRKVNYKPLASFTNIFAYTTIPLGLLVRNDSPVKSFQELVDHARQNPGKIKYGSGGTGTIAHTVMELIGRKEKVHWIHVPFKGEGPAATALLGGHIDAVSSGSMQLALTGQARPLLIYNKDRYFKYPDIPTTIERGYRYYGDTLFGILGPAGMDPEVVKKIQDAFDKALDMPAWHKVANSLGLAPLRMRTPEFTKFLEESWNWEIEVQKGLGLITNPATPPR